MVQLDLLLKPRDGRAAYGRVMRLTMPMSFWGGVEPASGRLSDLAGAHAGLSIAGRVLLIEELRGSSSSSAVLLELIYRRLAPAAIVINHADAILVLGAIVAAQMQWGCPYIGQLAVTEQRQFLDDERVVITEQGILAHCSPDDQSTA